MAMKMGRAARLKTVIDKLGNSLRIKILRTQPGAELKISPSEAYAIGDVVVECGFEAAAPEVLRAVAIDGSFLFFARRLRVDSRLEKYSCVPPVRP